MKFTTFGKGTAFCGDYKMFSAFLCEQQAGSGVLRFPVDGMDETW